VAAGATLRPVGASPSAPDDDEVAVLERELSVLLRRARAWSGELARAVHPDLEAAAYGLLMHVVDGGARATDLADYFGIDKSTVSRQVRLLEQLGLLRREPDPLDLRVLRLVATEEGERRLRSARDARRQRVEARLEGWDPADVGRLAGLLARYNASGS
jgi:DNA-binding MarR family transcriptional regulator